MFLVSDKFGNCEGLIQHTKVKNVGYRVEILFHAASGVFQLNVNRQNEFQNVIRTIRYP